MGKELILVLTYCPNKERKEILFNFLKQLQKFRKSYDILVASHTPLDNNFFEYFDYFCAENKITYYLMGGSALGAIRHKGFIPWDDDFDVFMDNENYHKFCKAASNKLDTDLFYFQKENTKEWPLFFSKIRMNGTTMIEKDVVGRAMHHGIYIDVMCLNKTVKSKAFRYVQYLAARILSATALSKNGYVTTSFVKRFLLMIVQVFSCMPSRP